MNHWLLPILLFVSVASFGQNFTYPKLIASSKKVADFVPANWTILDSASGDLTGDKFREVALVLQYRDSVLLAETYRNYNDTVLTQPRMLAILTYNSKTKLYHLLDRSNTFIMNHDNANMDNPYEEISISKGVLSIEFRIFMNAGGWNMSATTYKFRYQEKQFMLIGTECLDIHRGTGEAEQRSYNFLTRKVKVVTSNIETDEEKTEWRVLPLRKLKTFKTFVKPFTWEVEPGFYL